MGKFYIFFFVILLSTTAEARLLITEPSIDSAYVKGETISIMVDFSFNGKIASGANVRAITPLGTIPLKETTNGYEGNYRIAYSDPTGEWEIKVVGSLGDIVEEDKTRITVKPAPLKIQVISPGLEADKEKGNIEIIVLYPSGEIGRDLKVNATSSGTQNLVFREGSYHGVYNEKKNFDLKIEATDKFGNYGFSVSSVKLNRKSVIASIKENIIFIIPLLVIIPVFSLVALSAYQKSAVERLARKRQELENRKKEIQVSYFQGKVDRRQFDVISKSHSIDEERLKQMIEESRDKKLILKGLLRRLFSR